MHNLGLGLNSDITMTLHKIAFIQSHSYIDKINYIYEYLKNN